MAAPQETCESSDHRCKGLMQEKIFWDACWAWPLSHTLPRIRAYESLNNRDQGIHIDTQVCQWQMLLCMSRAHQKLSPYDLVVLPTLSMRMRICCWRKSEISFCSGFKFVCCIFHVTTTQPQNLPISSRVLLHWSTSEVKLNVVVDPIAMNHLIYHREVHSKLFPHKNWPQCHNTVDNRSKLKLTKKIWVITGGAEDR